MHEHLAPARRTAAAYKDSQPIREGVLLINLMLKSSVLCVICAYAPTNDSPEEQKDTFYGELQSAIDRVVARNTLVFVGDLDAQVGAENP